MKKVVYCKISSWKGRIEGAEHYYVDLNQQVLHRNSKKVWHNLTYSEAARINRVGSNREPERRFEVGEEVGWFFDLERAREGAIAVYKEMYPGAIILVEGDIGTYQPQLILDGPIEAMEAINELYQRAEENNGWEGDEDEMKAICDEWQAIWIPEFEEE